MSPGMADSFLPLSLWVPCPVSGPHLPFVGGEGGTLAGRQMPFIQFMRSQNFPLVFSMIEKRNWFVAF